MKRPINKRALRFEQLDDRRMLSASPQMGTLIAQNELVKAPTAGSISSAAIVASSASGSAATVSPVNTVALKSSSLVGPINQVGINPFFSKGTAWLDPSGTVYVQGTDSTNDTVTISIDTKGTASTADDMVKVDISNAGLPLTYEFALASVKQLNVQTYGGDDYVDNQTSIAMFADGGAGNDVILGGSGGDILYGGTGAGNDYIDGRAGDDMLIAGVGTDMLFGDDGNDSLYGAAGGKDYMFGGNGNDNLYAEGTNGFAFGEAGTDVLIDYTGTNKLYQDYGPTEGVVDQPGEFRLVRSQSGRSDGSLAGAGGIPRHALRSQRRLESVQRSGARWHGQRERVFRSAKTGRHDFAKAGRCELLVYPGRRWQYGQCPLSGRRAREI